MGIKSFLHKNYLWIISICSILLLILTMLLQNLFLALDQSVNTMVMMLWQPSFIVLFTIITHLLTLKYFIFLGLTTMAILVVKKRGTSLVFFIIALVGGEGIHVLLEFIVPKARPVDSLVAVSGNSFPSAHAAVGFIFFASLIYLFRDDFKLGIQRNIFICLCLALIILVAFSRIYLHAHWVSDVLGGLFLGLGWFSFMIFLEKKITALKKLDF